MIFRDVNSTVSSVAVRMATCLLPAVMYAKSSGYHNSDGFILKLIDW